MFGEPATTDNGMGGQVPAMDPGVMADPSSMPAMDAPAPEHQMTPAYQDDDLGSPAPSMSDDMSTPAPAVQSAVAPDADQDLMTIKQDALNALSPLVGQLDQTPDEKFRTTMMMIQASDDRTLVKQAYEAAQAITDEKTRAQALLDVINEINYFTSHTS